MFFYTKDVQKTMYLVVLLLTIMYIFLPENALASAGVGGGLPYEAWLEKLRRSVTGPVAYALAILGVVVAGGILLFGGDLNAFFRSFVLLVLVMGFVVGAENTMARFFGQGAIIAVNDFVLLTVFETC